MNNWFFELQIEIEINSLDDMLSLNTKKSYYGPGDTEVINDNTGLLYLKVTEQ